MALILLAAGESARLGTPKQLLRLEGRTLLRRAAQTALASGGAPVIVVVGARAEQMQAELDGLDVRVVHNPDWRQGMGSSLRAGLRALPGGEDGGSPAAPALVVMLCDQPAVTPALLGQLHATWQRTQAKIVACEYGGTVGVPALFDRRVFPHLLALPFSMGAKSLFRAHAEGLARVSFAGGAVDVDTPEDWAGLQAQGMPPPG